jgi:hypothetical protein
MPRQCNTREENEAIKRGQTPEDWKKQLPNANVKEGGIKTPLRKRRRIGKRAEFAFASSTCSALSRPHRAAG